VTGTYQVGLYDTDNTRYVGATYTVSSSATWEEKTITFPADTTGAFDDDNALSLILEFFLDGGTDYTSGAVPSSWEAASDTDRAAGLTVNLGDTIGNYWQITGVQLEAGETATEFEYCTYAEQLHLCKRYYQRFNANNAGGGAGYKYAGGSIANTLLAAGPFVPPLRTGATSSTSTTPTLNNIDSYSIDGAGPDHWMVRCTPTAAGVFRAINFDWIFDAEL